MVKNSGHRKSVRATRLVRRTFESVVSGKRLARRQRERKCERAYKRHMKEMQDYIDFQNEVIG